MNVKCKNCPYAIKLSIVYDIEYVCGYGLINGLIDCIARIWRNMYE